MWLTRECEGVVGQSWRSQSHDCNHGLKGSGVNRDLVFKVYFFA